MKALFRKLWFLCRGYVSSFAHRREGSVGFPIDFVITWVDGSDPRWLELKQRYSNDGTAEGESGECRYRDYGIFKYWFRAVETYAPWVNKVYLVTCGQVPSWLNLDHPKLVLVRHEDYINPDFLPTFNSRAIELNFHRIKGLSEHFVYFNDDMFLTGPVSPEDFFTTNGDPKLRCIAKPVVCDPWNGLWSYQFFRMIGLMKDRDWTNGIERHPEKWFSHKWGARGIMYNWGAYLHDYPLGMEFSHVGQPVRKATVGKIWEQFREQAEETSKHRFRAWNDLSQFIFLLFEIASDSWSPDHMHSEYIEFQETEKLQSALFDSTIKQICLNDTYRNVGFESRVKRILDLFERKFPGKCSLEY